MPINDPDFEERKRVWIDEQIAVAPPLTGELRERIVALLTPRRVPTDFPKQANE